MAAQLPRKALTPRDLTKQQAQALRKHAVHHSKKHIAAMKKGLREGKTFDAVHKEAMRRVGK